MAGAYGPWPPEVAILFPSVISHTLVGGALLALVRDYLELAKYVL